MSFEFQPAPRSGEDVATLKAVHKSYGSRSIYEGLDFQVRRKRALVRDGHQRRRQVDAA